MIALRTLKIRFHWRFLHPSPTHPQRCNTLQCSFETQNLRNCYLTFRACSLLGVRRSYGTSGHFLVGALEWHVYQRGRKRRHSGCVGGFLPSACRLRQELGYADAKGLGTTISSPYPTKPPPPFLGFSWITLSHCYTKKTKNPPNVKIARDKKQMSHYHAV
jgi:hypothetical protein